jgi:hypothetical protein
MIFLLKFREEIIGKSKILKQGFFISFAQQVAKPFKNPKEIVDIIFAHKDELLDQVSRPDEKISMERKLIKFACEFIIDSYEQDDKPPINLMMQIFSELVCNDLQHLKDFKDNLPKLCKISLEDIPAGRYLFGLTGNVEDEEKGEEEEKTQDDYEAIE